ncbi:putative rna binding effector protein scp160 protein [Botrytis fragariae]|uniref:Putative rna binding effector protein scp160 protein n=1 Tax=Botrytis fragariae TaxID=1964551 RepID=A0A8H6EFN7_9HELO|nr:putative rna binding effector protein scp160 protein [Botrytis fragariae]KAF5870423.1 putative rna binding effector protein scp160 protein [Botrytis fragariae]
MSAVDTAVPNGHAEANSSGPELTRAQKLMQQHDHEHQPSIEEVPDEEDLKHGEQPTSTSVLEDVNGDSTTPGWVPTVSTKAAGKQKEDVRKEPSIDTQSHELFPALGATSQPKPQAQGIWGGGKSPANANGTPTNGASRASTPISGAATPLSSVNRPKVNQPGQQHQERIELAKDHILKRDQLKKPLPEILREINKKYRSNITQTTGLEGKMTFTAYGPPAASRTGIKALMEQIGAKQEIHVTIPSKARAFIIGKQGSKIKELQEATGARIQMPKDNKAGPVDDDEDATVDVAIVGNAVAVAEAKKAIEKIVGEKAGTTKTKLRGIPSEFYRFIAGPHDTHADSLRNTHNLSELEIPSNYIWRTPPHGPEGPNFVPAAADNCITLNGDRAAVLAARAEIERRANQLHEELTRQEVRGISKGRHQSIIGEQGNPGEDFFARTGCALFVPDKDEQDNTITVVGPIDKIQEAVREARKLSTKSQSANIDISQHFTGAPDSKEHAFNLARYLRQRSELERLERLHNARIYTPNAGSGSIWEIFSEETDALFEVQGQLMNIMDAHPHSRMANIPVNSFYHKHLEQDISPRVKRDYGVHVVLPDGPNGDVLLVFEGPAGREPEYNIPRSQPSRNDIAEFKRGLEDARKHIIDVISSQAEITSESVDVPKIYHDKLKKFITAENKAFQIPTRVVANGTIVTLQGPRPTVEKLAVKVREFVAQAIEEEKERGYTLSFDFPQKHANQLIGKGGSFVNELREKFDVDIQLKDGQVEVKGPKAKADAAKSHISTLGRQWADETTYTLKIDPKFHPELIGAKGNQINRLQNRYKVQIHFPRSGRPTDEEHAENDAGQQNARRQQAPDEVSIKGPKKGADEARDEILSLFQYLQDNSHSATVSVQQSQIPSLIGQRGAGMEELRQLTGAKIDVPNSRDSADASGRVEIQIKGTASQVAKAKKLIEEKQSVFDSTVTETLDVDKKHHRALIGAGGANIHAIIVNAGGSGDRRELARVVQFPKAESEGNAIKVEGSRQLVDNIVSAIQKIVEERDSQTTETVDVPTDKHRPLIGAGGETKKGMEKNFKVSIDIPRQGSGQTGITVTGLPADVEKAKAHILELVKGQEGETVQVPRKLHHDISNNGQFFRKLRNDLQVTVDHAGAKMPARATPPSGASAKDALITDEKDTTDDVEEWFVFNKSESGETGDIPWVLRGSTENIAQAKSILAQAIEQASKNNFVGHLTLVDPSLYGSIVGKNGSKVNSIRKATGCNVTVPRGQGTDPIEVVGSEEGIEKAKELILQAVAEGKNKPARGGDRY